MIHLTIDLTILLLRFDQGHHINWNGEKILALIKWGLRVSVFTLSKHVCWVIWSQAVCSKGGCECTKCVFNAFWDSISKTTFYGGLDHLRSLLFGSENTYVASAAYKGLPTEVEASHPTFTAEHEQRASNSDFIFNTHIFMSHNNNGLDYSTFPVT